MTMRAVWCALVLAAGLCAVLAASVRAEDITVLTIKEQAGSARTNEPIRMGIPLAKGKVLDVAELALADAAGKPVPCQFRAVERWLDDKSVRWVHAVFQASVAAKGETTVTLVKGKPAQTAGKMTVTETDGTVTVDNGLLKLVVKGAGFNLFDSVAVNGSAVVRSHKEGFVATIDGKPYRAGVDSKVSVEEKGTEGAVVKAEGKLVDDAGQGPFSYVCYIHIYQGSPVVRVEFAYTNTQGQAAPDKVKLEDLSLVLPTTLAGGTAKVGGEGKVFSGKSAKIVAKSSDASDILVDGQAAGTAKGKSTKPMTIGWTELSAGTKSVAVGVRWFWQMFPKAMEAGDGKVRAALFAKEPGAPLDVYMGQGRTHYITVLFGDGTMDDAALSAFFAGTQMPLRAVCTPKYYCRESQAFGLMADADPALYAPDVLVEEKRFDDNIRQSVSRINKKIDGNTYNGVTLDSYGYYPWGDVFHHANDAGVTDPWNILWESNYYDYPWTVLAQFLRTGDMEYLDVCDRHGLHIADVFMCKWAPQKEWRGACRYSPPANHVGNDVDYKTPKPYFSVEFNHHKARSILARYLLLGDLRARDDFMLALNNATLNPEASWRQCRGAGAKLSTLYSGWLLTGDQLCLDKMKGCVAGSKKYKMSPAGFCENRESGYFMMGIAAEGLLYYWWASGDKDTLDTVQRMCDFLLPEVGKKNKDYITCNMTFAYGVMYRQTGEEKYKAAALKLFSQGTMEARPKGTGQQWRNVAHTWYYLSKLAEKDAK